MYRSFAFGVIATALGLASVTPSTADPACRPQLTVTDVQFSEMLPPTRERKWTAMVAVDASGCTTHASGYFDIVFTRIKENGVDLDFREQFIWMAPSAKIGITLAADEAVHHYRIDRVLPCICSN
jgi:hypothetical protein